MSELTPQLLRLFEQVGREMHNKVCDPDNEFSQKFTFSQIRLLRFLSHAKKSSMADIAEHLLITPASATSAVDRLVQLHWLNRINDEQDRRKVLVSIHPDKVKDWKAHSQDQLKRLTEFLNVLDSKQKSKLINILQSLVKQ